VTKTPHISDTTNSRDKSNHQSRLSSGTEAGIAVGVVGAVIIGLVLGFILLRRRRRRKSKPTDNDEDTQSTSMKKLDLEGPEIAELHDKPTLFEARDGERFEMPTPVVELEGDGTHPTTKK
jgi:Na+/glutamate symporter